jgi:hypothetical protein
MGHSWVSDLWHGRSGLGVVPWVRSMRHRLHSKISVACLLILSSLAPCQLPWLMTGALSTFLLGGFDFIFKSTICITCKCNVFHIWGPDVLTIGHRNHWRCHDRTWVHVTNVPGILSSLPPYSFQSHKVLTWKHRASKQHLYWALCNRQEHWSHPLLSAAGR